MITTNRDHPATRRQAWSMARQSCLVVSKGSVYALRRIAGYGQPYGCQYLANFVGFIGFVMVSVNPVWLTNTERDLLGDR